MKNIYWMLILIPSYMQGVAYAADFDAIIDFSPRIELSLPVSGVINKVSVVTGQRVNEGDEMLTLDPVSFLSEKKQAQSSLIVQQVSLAKSKRDLNHQQELYDRAVIAIVELENTEQRVKHDSALVENMKAQLAEADYAYSYSKLNAPFDALILAVHVNQGQSISSRLQNKTLISLVRQGHYLARFYVSIDELDKFSIGNEVVVNARDLQYQGTISTISYEPKQRDSINNKPYMIEAGFISKNKLVPIGHQASVQTN